MALVDEVRGWLEAKVPAGWFTEAPAVAADSEEILVLGRLPEPEAPRRASDAARRAARVAQIKRFRAATRDDRVALAREAEHVFGRKVSWGASCGEAREVFTTISVPVMTRLRMPERNVLDVLVESGVARSRSDALAWCVRLVGAHEADWIANLHDALTEVRRVRAEGPSPG